MRSHCRHRFADIFPIIGEDKLATLAADIKANGQLHPILADSDGALINGRNRLAASKLAGVEPRFEKLTGEDSVKVIVSDNRKRRNLTKGLHAMALALIYGAEKGRS